jgi:aminopeptidase YwaD
MRYAALAAFAWSGLAARVRAQTEAEFTEARMAWERGDYPAALRGFERILQAPGAGAFHERIALITGELFRTVELTRDGRAVRFSNGGRWVVFERGSVADVWTVMVRSDLSGRDSLPGSAAVVDDASGRVAFLRRGRLVLRDLASGRELAFPDTSLAVTSPVFGPGGDLYFLGKRSGASAVHVFRWRASGSLEQVTMADGLRSGLQGGTHGKFIYQLGSDPFSGGGLGGRAGGAGAREFALLDAATGSERRFEGLAPSLAPDGSAVVYLQRLSGENAIYWLSTSGDASPVLVRRGPDNVDAPVLSPGGGTIAFQLMPREDWEIYLVDADGKNERRLTREIQHDVLPRWVNGSTLLAMIGEPRHRRSYLYDLSSGVRRRLFHNNTVRTVAPEYEWAVAPDGLRIAIVAERDGDTVSPERGVYLTILTDTVSRGELLARIRTQLAAELALRDEAQRRFAPLAADIRTVVESVSKDRIYSYAHDLFQFDSKYITQPGNARAIAYLDSVYRSFGYQTELQWFEPRPGIRTANVVATLKGTVSPDAVYVVGSHFDSVQGGPGADDNSSGTTMLLETARVLANRPLPATVKFVSFTGEEAGLLGSREFVRRMQADSIRLVGVLNNDMMGWSNDQRLDNTIRYSNPGIRDVQHGAALQFSRLITYDALYYKSTDAAAFYEAYGDIVGGFGSYPILGNPHYHQRHDVLETINFEQVAENTKANVATVMLLASAPSRLAGLVVQPVGGAVELRWQPSVEHDVVRYVVSYRDGSGAERTLSTSQPAVRLPALPAGSEIKVKAVNRRGLEGWDWARVRVP